MEDFSELFKEEEEEKEEREELEAKEKVEETPQEQEAEEVEDILSRLAPEERKTAAQIYLALKDNPTLAANFIQTVQGYAQSQPVPSIPTIPQAPPIEEEEEEDIASKIWEKPVEVIEKISQKKIREALTALAPFIQTALNTQIEQGIANFKREIEKLSEPVQREALRRFETRLRSLPLEQQISSEVQRFLGDIVLGELTREGKIDIIKKERVARPTTPLSSGESSAAPSAEEETYVPEWVRDLGERMGLDNRTIKKIWNESAK